MNHRFEVDEGAVAGAVNERDFRESRRRAYSGTEILPR